MALVGLAPAELADRRRLADAVDSHEQPHARGPFGVAKIEIEAGQPLLQLGLERVEQLLTVGEALLFHTRPQVLEELLRRLHAHVGADEGFFELVPGLTVDLVAADDRSDVARQQPAGFGEPIPESRFDRRLWRRLGDDRFGFGDDRFGLGRCNGFFDRLLERLVDLDLVEGLGHRGRGGCSLDTRGGRGRVEHVAATSS